MIWRHPGTRAQPSLAPLIMGLMAPWFLLAACNPLVDLYVVDEAINRPSISRLGQEVPDRVDLDTFVFQDDAESAKEAAANHLTAAETAEEAAVSLEEAIAARDLAAQQVAEAQQALKEAEEAKRGEKEAADALTKAKEARKQATDQFEKKDREKTTADEARAKAKNKATGVTAYNRVIEAEDAYLFGSKNGDGEVVDANGHKARVLRNRLQSYLMEISDRICVRHVGSILANSASAEFLSGLSTSVLGATGAIFTGGTSEVLSAAALMTSAAGAHVNESFYQNLFAEAIVREIERDRRELREEIVDQQGKSVSRYSADQAIRDVNAYHYRCSFFEGLVILTKEGASRKALTRSQVDREICKLEKENDELWEKYANQDNPEVVQDGAKRSYTLNKARIRQLRLDRLSAPGAAEASADADSNVDPKADPSCDPPAPDSSADKLAAAKKAYDDAGNDRETKVEAEKEAKVAYDDADEKLREDPENETLQTAAKTKKLEWDQAKLDVEVATLAVRARKAEYEAAARVADAEAREQQERAKDAADKAAKRLRDAQNAPVIRPASADGEPQPATGATRPIAPPEGQSE